MNFEKVFIGVDQILSQSFSEGELENKEFELIHTSVQYSNKYGVLKYAIQELEDMAKNFNENVLEIEVAVDINHDPSKKAYAWIKPGTMRVDKSRIKESAYSLYAQLYRFTEEGKKDVSQGAFRYFSLEIRPRFEKIVNGVKKTYTNVISGLALTNAPVYKGLSPTFSEDPKFIYSNALNRMNPFKIYLSSLLSKEFVSKDEKKMLSEMVVALSEDEQTEAKADVEKVEAKPEEKPAEKKDDADAAEIEKAKAEAEKAKAEKEAAEKKLSEIDDKKKDQEALNVKLSERIQALETERDEKLLSEDVNAVMLSDTRSVGFNKDSSDKVTSFMKKLNPELRKEFSELIDNVQRVDLSEYGYSSKQEYADKTDHAKANQRAKEIVKEKKEAGFTYSYAEALADAYTEMEAK